MEDSKSEISNKTLTKITRVKHIDVHPTEIALVITLEIEATIVGSNGIDICQDKKECHKIIRLCDASFAKNSNDLANEIIKRAKVLEKCKVNEIIHLLNYLKKRRLIDHERASLSPSVHSIEGLSSNANIRDLNKYILLLKGDNEARLQGTRYILQLVRDPEYISEVAADDAVMNTCISLFLDEGLNNLELSINLVCMFACLANFRLFRPILQQFNFNSQTIKIIGSELEKSDNFNKQSGSFQISKAVPQSSFGVKINEDVRIAIQKQNLFFKYALHVLLKTFKSTHELDEESAKTVIAVLDKMLLRTDVDVIAVTVRFLRTLSIYRQCKDQMYRLEITCKLARLLNCTDESFVNEVLWLLYNLSFDKRLRIQIINIGLLPKIIQLMDKYRDAATYLVYQLSRTRECRHLFSLTEVVHMVMKIICYSNENLCTEHLFLCANLSTDSQCCEQICSFENGKGLEFLIRKAIKHDDFMIAKILRNIASHSLDKKSCFYNHLNTLFKVLKHPKSNKSLLLADTAALIANVLSPSFDPSLLQNETDFDWLKKKVVSEPTEDGVRIELIGLIANICTNVEFATSFATDNSFIETLVSLLDSMRNLNISLASRILFTFYQLLMHETLRANLLCNRSIYPLLMHLMHENHPYLNSYVNACVRFFCESDNDKFEKFTSELFRIHNSHWLEVIDNVGKKDGLVRIDVFEINDSCCPFTNEGEIEGVINSEESDISAENDSHTLVCNFPIDI